ncbi:copper-binding protein [Agrobacterium rosae]|uniref:copper-binding protein n=1 Tax=Agrobacterium rosae TaxID=1972867 RepID=UPI003BA1FB92
MNNIIKIGLAAAIALSSAAGAFAQEFTNGTVKKLDTKAKKVTLIHEELKGLEMPAMTMVFEVKDDTVLAKLKEGAKVQFVAERVNGKLTVTQVK